MRLRIPVLLSLLTVSNATSAQAFPSITGETADGRPTTVPAGNGRYTVVGMAFSQKASPMLEEWYEPAYLRFVAKHGLFAGAYNADVVFVPVFTGMNKAAYEPSLRKFRRSATPEVVDLVVFVKGEWDEMSGALGLKDRDVPYFFVLDPAGRIVHRSHGGYDLDKLDAIEEVLIDSR